MSLPFYTKIDTEVHDGEKVPLLSGRYLNFKKVADDDDPFANEKRQKALLQAMREMEMTERPCMVVDLAPMRDVEAIIDGKAWEPTDPSELEEKRPPCAKLVVPASQLVDIEHLRPKVGRSVVRCNKAYPAFRWFQAINLLLHHKGIEGRVIPFPLETNPDAKTPSPATILYHVMRVSKEEFEMYQKLLQQACDNDGLEMGFYHAAKFSYEVLFKRGYTEISEKVVGETVTNVVLMGKSLMRGVLIEGVQPEDFTEEFAKSHFIFE